MLAALLLPFSLTIAAVTPGVCYDGYQGEQQVIIDHMSTSGHQREAARAAARLGDLALECYARGLAGRETAGDANFIALENYKVATDLYAFSHDAKSTERYARLVIAMAARADRGNAAQYQSAQGDARIARVDAGYFHIRL